MTFAFQIKFCQERRNDHKRESVWKLLKLGLISAQVRPSQPNQSTSRNLLVRRNSSTYSVTQLESEAHDPAFPIEFLLSRVPTETLATQATRMTIYQCYLTGTYSFLYLQFLSKSFKTHNKQLAIRILGKISISDILKMIKKTLGSRHCFE